MEAGTETGIRKCRGRRSLAALVLAVVLGVVSAPASASTAALVQLPPAPCKPLAGEVCLPPTETALLYAAGGEANRVRLGAAPGGRVGITDSGAVIQPGRGCARVDDHSVTCSQPSATRLPVAVLVAAGGGSDRVTPELVEGVAIDGGSGSDVLTGGPGPDLLFGGSGIDRLRGLGGDDRLHDASLRNFVATVIDPAPPVPARTVSPGLTRDSYDGGAGKDTISYEGRAARLRINLASSKALAGARGERDSIRRMEHAVAGSAADRLAGNRGANLLDGARGDDVLAGGGGPDRLQGGRGNDVIRGGTGNDAINLPGPASADRIACGTGRDIIGTAFPRDLVAADCEKLSFYPPGPPERLQIFAVDSLLPLRRARTPRVLRGALGCTPDAVCEARAELRVDGPASRRDTSPPRGTLLGSHAVTLVGTQTATFELRLSSRGVRLLDRHRALRVRVSIASQFSGTRPSGYTTLLRAP